MGRIHLLEDAVINKIAAGEVVERPASVVKELVENAVDAGARRIDITLELGGTRSIVVADDGLGMSPTDAELAVQRHATSKIRYADDLFQVASMGFRGEALASIASVSRFTLSTRPRGENAGTRLVLVGGETQPLAPWHGPEGTTVVVESLFFNTPVRAKFLKAPSTEYGHCLELVQAFALCHPQIAFSLSHNGREQFRVAAIEGLSGETLLRTRAAAVVGRDVEAQLCYVSSENRYGSVTALVSPPGHEKVSAKQIWTFVNGRWVKDKTVRYGILRGYHTHLLKGRFPIALVALRVDPALVDVNVHPAKTELRFQYPAELQNLLALAIRERLRDADWAGGAAPKPSVARPQPMIPDDDVPSVVTEKRTRFDAPIAAASLRTGLDAMRLDVREPSRSERFESRERFAGRTSLPSIRDKADLDALLSLDFTTPSSSSPAPAATKVPWTEMDYLGAFDRCYLFFAAAGRLLVVDQHAFHERILFERLARDESLLGKSQPLLVPEAVELSPAEISELRARRHLLVKRGFDYDIEGDTTVAVKALPAILAGRSVADVFAGLAQEVAIEEGAGANADLARHLLATAACHAAVRAGEELGANELRQLLAEAHTVDFFHNCPHGRRVFKWWSHEQVATWFDR